MSRLLYVDTSAFIALLYERDHWHAQVSAHLRKLRADADRLVTSEPVISETVTRLRYDTGLTRVTAFRVLLDRAVAQGSLVIRDSDEQLRRSAFVLLEQFEDLRLSYADAVGAVIARERRVDGVFGLDHHFRIMGFALEP